MTPRRVVIAQQILSHLDLKPGDKIKVPAYQTGLDPKSSIFTVYTVQPGFLEVVDAWGRLMKLANPGQGRHVYTKIT